MVWSFLFLGTLDSVSYYYCCLLGQATITQVGRAKLTTVKTSTKETFAASLFNTACKRSTRKYPGLASTRRHESVIHNVTQPKTKHSHSPGWIEQLCQSLLRSQGAAAPTQFLQMSWCPMISQECKVWYTGRAGHVPCKSRGCPAGNR